MDRGRLHQRAAVVQESAGGGDAAIFVVAGGAGGGGNRGCVDARIDARDQVVLPAEALDLPGAKGAETGKQQKGDQRQADQEARGTPAALPGLERCHGISLMSLDRRISCVEPMSISICGCGIMLALR